MSTPILICAQRVRSKTSGTHDIHVYDYDLDERPSDPLAPFEKDYKGRKLVRKHVVFEGGGNEILSYLDVVTPDRPTFWQTLQRLYAKRLLDDEMPAFQLIEGQLALRFGVCSSPFLVIWRNEFKELARHILVP